MITAGMPFDFESYQICQRALNLPNESNLQRGGMREPRTVEQTACEEGKYFSDPCDSQQTP